jgi:predicted helicase
MSATTEPKSDMDVSSSTIYRVLDDLRRFSTDERQKGDRFEDLMADFLVTDPTYGSRFAVVMKWTDWPGRGGRVDTGIDLVAQERETGDLCAIQCKFYDPDHHLAKEDLDSFFTESGKVPFKTRMVISTTDHWSKHAEAALENQQIPVTRLRVQDLDASPVDWSRFNIARPQRLQLRDRKKLRPHQEVALEKVLAGLGETDRGKLIMACGTGKTFTSLRIAETMVGAGGKVLFLVPSISLLSQSLKEWSSEALVPLRVFAVCSDPRAGKRTASEDIGPYDLAYPATTDAARLAQLINTPHAADAMTVVFSTYQSIDKVADAQKAGVGRFDLVICDEAHRTTGVTLADDDESAFVRVHDDSFLGADNRLYMTGTPRIYDVSSKERAKEKSAELCSMDDENKYGPELHRLGFGEAVERNLLADYRVLVLAVDQEFVSRAFQHQLADSNHELTLDDAAKIVGCLNGLAKRGVSEQTFAVDPAPMRRAVAFCSSIKGSQKIVRLFHEVSSLYQQVERNVTITAEAQHVDGTFNALVRAEKLDWLRGEVADGTCKVLSNARCLSEGVDVPALDAVMFLQPRKSIVDVVQGVGRVMRTSPNTDKKYGYVILPIGVPAGVTAEVALADNERYRVVWQVLQALRAHDDRFNAMVNKIDLNKTRDDSLQVIGVGGGPDQDRGGDGKARPAQGSFVFADLEAWRGAIYAKIVEKVGDRRYWEDWAKDVADIGQRQTARIKALLADPAIKDRFHAFVDGLRCNINESVTDADAIEMLSQHLITRPVFEALFSDYDFVDRNPVSLAMQDMVNILGEHGFEKETAELEGFYASVRRRAEGIDNAEGKQRIVLELYEKFFKTALPQVTDRLGIVYTPVEIVDFMVKSVEEVLRDEFGVGLADKGVHVLDPFTGTGTFIVRLIQSRVIDPSALVYKFGNELHANEIVLLAYYIAAINIEAAFHGVAGDDFTPFDGIVFTDTFQLYESGDSMDTVFFPQNNARVRKQKAADIRVVIANPPYSVGQTSENDANKNLKYPLLDQRIRETYAARSDAGLMRGLYDSYVRAFRWASDRVKDKGIICFVTNGAFIDTATFDGFRKSLMDEFTSVYCFNLRGNQRTAGELSRKEGGKVFGSGSRTPVAITLLVRNPDRRADRYVHYCDIGDYLSREEKLARVRDRQSTAGVTWEAITPNPAGDWINQRSEEYEHFLPLVDGASTSRFFMSNSQGVKTNRDAWVYNFSRRQLLKQITEMGDFYNELVPAFQSYPANQPFQKPAELVEQFLLNSPELLDTRRISWSRDLKNQLRQERNLTLDEIHIVPGLYRPYCKHWLYFHRRLNQDVYQIPSFFPTTAHSNLVICTSGVGARRPFSAIITDAVPNRDVQDTGQCFPLHVFVKPSEGQLAGIGGDIIEGYERRDGVTDAALSTFQARYSNVVTKEDIFYYVYGLLHSPTYRVRFAADLKKMLPRLPMVENFSAFSQAGRELAHWHLGYETVDPYPLDGIPELGTPAGQLKVVEMRFPKAGGTEDRSRILFNNHVTLSGIPDEAYTYQIEGKSALDWVMERYKVTTDKASGIRNDPNQWSDDPRYVVDLVGRIVRVSLETVRIVDSLPKLHF